MTGDEVEPSDVELDIRYDNELGPIASELRERQRSLLEAQEKKSQP